ncbi:hypothetical protein RAX51_003823 [Vibrio fluvialis]|nr:hypothetical protein [Vibrio fluvialis]MBY7943435.1 hypothetical protein [Vibrio fluvialis]
MHKATLFVTALCCSFSVSAKEGWEASFGLGGALNLQESITIKMDNGERIESSSVSLNTKPFNSPPYYNLRTGYWKDDTAWEVEFIHHKLYANASDLDDRVQNFEITDGYNLLYLNYAAVYTQGWNVRAGFGVVIPHPDVTVDNQRSHGGYQLGGVTTQLALEREFVVSDSVLFSLEGKVTYSYAEIDLDYGKATVPNTALHLLGQFKFRL